MYFSAIVLLYERNPVKAMISIAHEKRNVFSNVLPGHINVLSHIRKYLNLGNANFSLNGLGPHFSSNVL